MLVLLGEVRFTRASREAFETLKKETGLYGASFGSRSPVPGCKLNVPGVKSLDEVKAVLWKRGVREASLVSLGRSGSITREGLDLSSPKVERMPPGRARLRRRIEPASKWPLKHSLLRGKPLEIEAVAVACGGDLLEELEVFLRQLFFFHPDWPVYVLTDSATAKSLPPELAERVAVLDVLDEEGLDALIPEAGKEHGPRWSRKWIGAKLEVFRRAVERWNCGVLLCDSDIVFTRSLPEMSWDADLVLSTHGGPFHWGNVPEFHGYFNAGVVLAREIEIVNRWVELYRTGRSSFFEQQCLETLADELVVDTFPESWNWGGWRTQEKISATGRRPALLHTHLVGKYKDDDARNEALKDVKALARAAVKVVKTSQGTPARVGFVHFAKAAGTTFSALLRRRVAAARGYRFFDGVDMTGPLHEPGTITVRDYTEAELLAIAGGYYRGERPSRWIVHNHAQNWTEAVVDHYLEQGVELVAFYRPILDRLLSFYYYSRRLMERNGWTVILPPAGEAESLEEFLESWLSHEVYDPEWTLPAWHEKIQNWFPANSEGIVSACESLFRIDVEAGRQNASSNPGWKEAVDKGDVSSGLQKRVLEDPRVKAWQAFASDRRLDF